MTLFGSPSSGSYDESRIQRVVNWTKCEVTQPALVSWVKSISVSEFSVVKMEIGK
jgi:hypothetical protein